MQVELKETESVIMSREVSIYNPGARGTKEEEG